MSKPIDPDKEWNEWNSAIKDAENRIKRLRKAVKMYKKMRDAGERWPGFDITKVEMSKEKSEVERFKDEVINS